MRKKRQMQLGRGGGGKEVPTTDSVMASICSLRLSCRASTSCSMVASLASYCSRMSLACSCVLDSSCSRSWANKGGGVGWHEMARLALMVQGAWWRDLFVNNVDVQTIVQLVHFLKGKR